MRTNETPKIKIRQSRKKKPQYENRSTQTGPYIITQTPETQVSEGTKHIGTLYPYNLLQHQLQ